MQFSLLNKYSGVLFLAHVERIRLVLKETAKLLSQRLQHCALPPVVHGGASFSTPSGSLALPQSVLLTFFCI